MNKFTSVAVVCILFGSLLLVGPSFGFTTISADRAVSASVAADQENAFLGIVDQTTENDVQIRRGNGGVPIRLSDNGLGIESPADLDVTVSEFDGEEAAFDASIEDGSDGFLVRVECDGATRGEGKMTFDIAASGDASVATTWTTENDVSVRCGGGGPGGAAGLNAVSVEPSDGGNVEFDVNNTGEDFRIRAVTIDHANSSEISNDMRIATGGDVVSASANRDWLTDGETEAAVPGSGLTISSTDTATVVIDEFDTDMNAESFEVTFIDTRGSTDTTDTVAVDVPCDTASYDCSDSDSSAGLGQGETTGEIDTDTDVTTGDDSTVNDGISAGDSVETGDGSTVNGDFESDGDVTIGDDATVNDGVEADGSITVGQRTTINGDLIAGGTVTVGENSLVNDNINADGDVSLADGTTVHGDVTSGGSVTTGDDVTINGGVSEG